MGQQCADEHTHGQETPGRVLKRRGILAAAGAVVAGIVAKQASVPVAAAHYNLQGDTGLTFYNLANDRTLIFANGPFPASTPVLDVEMTGSDLTLGADLAVGVKGASNRDAGVWGVSSAASKPGVYGTSLASGTGIGVLGVGDAAGVIGQSSSGIGVQGDGACGYRRVVPGWHRARAPCPRRECGERTARVRPPGGRALRDERQAVVLLRRGDLVQVLLAPVGRGVPPAPAARPSSASTTTQPVQPIPPPRP